MVEIPRCHASVTTAPLSRPGGSDTFPRGTWRPDGRRASSVEEVGLLVRRASWPTVKVALGLLSVGSTLITSPSQAATEGRIHDVSNAAMRGSAAAQSLGGSTFD